MLACAIMSSLSAFLTSCGGDDEPVVDPTTLKVSPTSLTFSSTGGSQTIKIQSNSTWSVSPSVGWVSATPMTGTGNGTVVITLPEQSSMDKRTCEVVIQTDNNAERELVYVSQEGARAVLSVDVTELMFEELAKCERTIHISSNTKWTISDVPEWLDLSTSSGNADAVVTLITSTDNNSSEVRSAEITITASGGEYRKVSVSQKGKYVKDCAIEVSDVLCLANSVAFKLNFDANVAYYYEALTSPEVIERMTDGEIVAALLEGTRYIPNDGNIEGFSADPESTYTLCFVAFDKNDKQGDLTLVEVATPTDVNQPEAWISDFYYDSYYIYWTYTISAYCRYFYDYTESAATSYDMTFWYDTDAVAAWYIKNYMERYPESFTPIVQSGDWYGERSEDSNYFQIITWGVGLEDKLAGVINNRRYSIEDQTRSQVGIDPDQEKMVLKHYSTKNMLDKLHGRIRLVERW